VASGCLGWSSNLTSMRFRLVWICVLGLGVLSSSLGFKAISIIKFAQVANGLLLPIIAIFLLWVMNNSKVLKDKVNTTFQNSLGLGIIIVTVVLGIKGILSVLDIV
jgi:Mn2+/Fe2+ NRAMP family transporter